MVWCLINLSGEPGATQTPFPFPLISAAANASDQKDGRRTRRPYVGSKTGSPSWILRSRQKPGFRCACATTTVHRVPTRTARADLFDPAPVRAEIRVPHARGRADVDLPAGGVEQELYVVHEAEDAAAKLAVPVCLLFDDELGVAGRQHGRAGPHLGLRKVAGPGQRRNAARC